MVLKYNHVPYSDLEMSERHLEDCAVCFGPFCFVCVWGGGGVF